MDERNQSYQYIVERFKREKIESRYNWLYKMLNNYIESMEAQEYLTISTDILNHVVIDYFVDIDRLKEFHDIEKAHETKIYSYLSYWLLRRKPLQVARNENAEKYAFCNEQFVCYFLRSYMFAEPAGIPIMNNYKDNVDNFVNTLLYYLKYREHSAKSIELMLLAFSAGRGYQYSVDYQNGK